VFVPPHQEAPWSRLRSGANITRGPPVFLVVPQHRRRVLTALALVASAIAGAFALKAALYPAAWHLRSGTNAQACTIHRGWASKQVAAACGSPDASGFQPKVASNTRQLFCSAPCERRGSLVALYDCDGRVTDVVGAEHFGSATSCRLQ
jgi:hypothetical protein